MPLDDKEWHRRAAASGAYFESIAAEHDPEYAPGALLSQRWGALVGTNAALAKILELHSEFFEHWLVWIPGGHNAFVRTIQYENWVLSELDRREHEPIEGDGWIVVAKLQIRVMSIFDPDSVATTLASEWLEWVQREDSNGCHEFAQKVERELPKVVGSGNLAAWVQLWAKRSSSPGADFA